MPDPRSHRLNLGRGGASCAYASDLCTTADAVAGRGCRRPRGAGTLSLVEGASCPGASNGVFDVLRAGSLARASS